MTNKFRGLEPLEPGQPPAKPPVMGLDGGFRGDVSPRLLQPNESPELNDVRFERRGIRRDFGWQAVGTAAAQVVRALLEHKYIDANQTFHRLIRIYINGGGNAELEVWDGATWVATDTSVDTVPDVYLDAVSALGCAYFSSGEQVLEWCEVLEKFDQENDFPAGNSLTTAGASVSATITPANPGEQTEYTINYDVTVNSSPTQDTTIVLEFFHGAVSLGEVTHVISQFETFPVTLADQTFSFIRDIADLETVTIEVKSAEGGGTTLEPDPVATAAGGPDPDLIGDKTPPTEPAIDDNYEFSFVLSGVVGTVTIGFYIDNGAGFALQTTQDYTTDGTKNFTINVPNFIDPGAQFGINVESGTGTIGITLVEWLRSNANFSVHGHNKASNGDDPAGVTYQTTGAVVSQFETIDPGPGGRFLEFFARRLVVLRSYGDTQALTWSADGVLTDFTGAGSGEIILVEARSDPVDDLMGTAVLNSNFMALFRKRSIMRVFETQLVDPALGAVDWIEELGTNSPFSIRRVRGGAIFLGNDQMVYFLTEQGPQAIGLPIQQELIEQLTEDLDLVDSAWDSTFQEYYLGVPVLDSGEITRVWVFDVQKFLDEQRLVWRRRPMTIQRFAARGVSEVE